MNWKDIGHEIGRRAQEKAKKDLLPSMLRHAASFLTDTAMLLERPEVMQAGFKYVTDDKGDVFKVDADAEETEGPGPAPKQGGDIVINTFGGSEDNLRTFGNPADLHHREVRYRRERS